MQRKGFRLPQRTALMDFAGTDYDGARVRCKLTVLLGTLLEFQSMADSQAAETLVQGFQKFGSEILLEWNLESEQGEPIPANAAGMMQIDQDFARELFTRWVQVVSQPPAPLPGTSANGSTSVAPLGQTVESSLNLGDLSRQS